MSIIRLEIKEREKFAAYLVQEATTIDGIAEQMEKLKGHDIMVKRLRERARACLIIAQDLRRIEDMNIN